MALPVIFCEPLAAPKLTRSVVTRRHLEKTKTFELDRQEPYLYQGIVLIVSIPYC